MGRTSTRTGRDKAVAVYHDMRVHEKFEQCAHRLHEVILSACRTSPRSPRVLFLDVQGHRNSAGGYDQDAFEIMTEFLFEMLLPYLTEAHTPLMHVRNPKRQRNDVPDGLSIMTPSDAESAPPRDACPDPRRSKPTLQAIADYLGLDEPACIICCAQPVERAHARPVALGGSNDVRNFALLCRRHHEMAPDVSDSNSFWRWVDWRLALDHPLGTRRRSGVVAEETSFFAQVRQEAAQLYGCDLTDLTPRQWSDLMERYHHVLDVQTGRHFGVQRKVSTHAYALSRAFIEVTGQRGDVDANGISW